MRHLRVMAITSAVLAIGGASLGSAIPIRNLSVHVGAYTSIFQGKVFSPPNARYCTARVRVVIGTYPGGRKVTRLNGTIRVCTSGASGWTSAWFRAHFHTPVPGEYIACARASQVTRNTQPSTHTACQRFSVS